MKLVVITVSNPIISDMIEANKRIKEKYGDILDLKLFYIGRGTTSKKLIEIEKVIEKSDFTILDLMGAAESICSACLRGCKKSKGNIVNIGGESAEIRSYLKLGSLKASDMGMGKKKSGQEKKDKKVNMQSIMKMIDMAEKMGKIMPFGKFKDMKNFVHIGKYWRNTGVDEITNLLYLILRDYGNIKQIPKPEEPKVFDDIAVCNPKSMKRYINVLDYMKENNFLKEKPNVVIFFYGHSYPNDTHNAVAKIVERFSLFANVVPIAFTSVIRKNLDELKGILKDLDSVDLVINLMSFRLGAGPMGGNAQEAIELLKKLNVPYMQPFFMTKREISEWEESIEGVTPPEFLISIMLPELDGAIETIPLGAINVEGRNKDYDVEISEINIIEDRVEKLALRVEKWINLRRKSNKDKKIGIICYNYPPGEGNLFGGAFLDTFASIENILKVLNEEGYYVEAKTKDELIKDFTDGQIANSGKWTTRKLSNNMITYDVDKYKKGQAGMDCYKETVEEWGEAPGNIMTEGNKFLIPGKIYGNIFIGLQPTRGVHENPERAYHDKTIPPHHQYQAFYKWMKEEFDADILLHVGTHGTLEFLKGKECGMSSNCFSDMLIYDIPHAYIYYCGNPSEAVIAKRRSQAVLTGYQSPSFVEGDLYGDLLELEILVSQYYEAERVDPTKCNEIRKKITEKAEEFNFNGQNLDELEGELYRIRSSLVPKGLHVFGEGFSKEEAIEYMKFVLRYDRGQIRFLQRLVAEKKGFDYDKILEDNDIETLKVLDEEASNIVEDFLENKKIDEMYIDTLNFGKKYFEISQKSYELQGLLKVLNGEYIPAKLAGDIFRSPEVLPTGYNLYQFDPRLVPSEIALERGKRIAENTINEYKKHHGKYPNSVATVLWGLETSKTKGETLGQIFHYLGVRPIKKKDLFHPEYEIIPIEKLGRPRIDVTINICGFFRDTFPNIIDDINLILERLYLLDESDDQSFFKANSKKIYEKFRKEGYTQENAKELACARIFGPKEGEYGTELTTTIENRNWTEESEIGEEYIKNLNHVYSMNYSGKKVDGLLEEFLSTVDIVSQTRSSHEYEITDLDHYYEFFGGLAKSVEISKGEKAEMYISDTTREKIQTESVEKSIERGARTRLLNPKWINGMLKHKYHGVQEIEKRFENMIGLAATTNKVESWLFDDLHSTYISDENLREKLKENNRWAYLDIIERLFEAKQREYWEATEEQLEELRKVYFEIEGSIEEKI